MSTRPPALAQATSPALANVKVISPDPKQSAKNKPPAPVQGPDMLASALEYARHGWAVLPCHWPDPQHPSGCSCEGKAPNCKAGKHPLTRNGVKDATTDPKIIRAWWDKWPLANIGLALGEASGGRYAFDFDIDAANIYPQFYAQADNPPLATQTTGNGLHAVFSCEVAPAEANRTLAASEDSREVIRFKTSGGYIMASPSLHASGRRYAGNILKPPALKPGEVAKLISIARRFDKTPKQPDPVPMDPPQAQALPDDTASILAGWKARGITPDIVLSRPQLPPKWLIKDLVQVQELVFVTAPEKSLKSFWLADVLIDVACGLPALPRPNGSGGLATTQTNVLWIDTDNGEWVSENRLRAIAKVRQRAGIPFTEASLFDFDLSDPTHINAALEWAKEIGAGVLVIDTLSGAMQGKGMNLQEDIGLPAKHLRMLCECGFTVFVVAHPNKEDPTGILGGRAWAGKVDRQIFVERPDPDKPNIILKPQRQRNVPAENFYATFAPTVLPDKTLAEARFFGADMASVTDPRKAKILELLQGGQEYTTTQVNSALGGRPKDAQTARDELLAEGIISQRFEGKSIFWRLANG